MFPAASPDVSVLVPAYRVTPYIADALDSVLSQTFHNFEIIVVNDGCPDTANLEKALYPYRGRITYLKQENGGPSAARNTAIQAARAPLVALLDADDIWKPEYLECQLQIMRSDPAIDLVYTNMEIFGDSMHAGRNLMEVTKSEGEVTFESLIEQKCIVLNCAMMKRDAVLRAGLWYPPLRHSEDFDLWVRITFQGGRIVYQRRPLAGFRIRAGSLSRNNTEMYTGQLCVYERVARLLPLTPAQRSLVERQIELTSANIDFSRGKAAFDAGDLPAARTHLAKANAVLKQRKLGLTVLALKLAPGLLHTLARIRRLVNPNFQF